MEKAKCYSLLYWLFAIDRDVKTARQWGLGGGILIHFGFVVLCGRGLFVWGVFVCFAFWDFFLFPLTIE